MNTSTLYKNLNLSRLVRYPTKSLGLLVSPPRDCRDLLSSTAYQLVLDTRNFTPSFVLVETKTDGFTYFLLCQWWPNQRTLRRYNLRPDYVFVRDKYMTFRVNEE